MAIFRGGDTSGSSVNDTGKIGWGGLQEGNQGRAGNHLAVSHLTERLTK